VAAGVLAGANRRRGVRLRQDGRHIYGSRPSRGPRKPAGTPQ
jgi:hypothetical protein